MILQSFKEMLPSQPLPGVMPWSNISTKNSVIRGSNFKGHKPVNLTVNLSDTFKTKMKLYKQSFCVIISWREQDGAQPIISYVVYLFMVDMCFNYNTEVFALVFAKLKYARSCFKRSLKSPILVYIML